MIGTKHLGYEVIAAVPASGDTQHVMTGVKRGGRRHMPQYATWITTQHGGAASIRLFTAHDKSADDLRDAALLDMFTRAFGGRLILAGLESV